MGKEIQIVGQDIRPIIEGTYDIPAGLFIRENVLWAKYTDPETLETKETNVFDGAGTVLPTPSAEDAGKALVVGEDGALEYSEIGGGSGEIEYHKINIVTDEERANTIADLVSGLVSAGLMTSGGTVENLPIELTYKYNEYGSTYSTKTLKAFVTIYDNYMKTAYIYRNDNFAYSSRARVSGALNMRGTIELDGELNCGYYDFTYIPAYKIPYLAASAEEGTYVLKATRSGGQTSVEWVKEEAAG